MQAPTLAWSALGLCWSGLMPRAMERRYESARALGISGHFFMEWSLAGDRIRRSGWGFSGFPKASESGTLARVRAICVDHIDVPLERLVDLALDLDERALFHAVGPVRIAFERKPVEARSDP